MYRVRDPRWEQLRAVESELLDPAPEDPFSLPPTGWSRASDLSDADWEMMATRFPAPKPQRAPSPIPDRPSSRLRRRPAQLQPRGAPMRSAHGRRTPPMRQLANQLGIAPYPRVQQAAPVPVAALAPAPAPVPLLAPLPAPLPVPAPDVSRRRPLSPTQLPGVRAIPKNYNQYFRGLLEPGEYFAKSHTQYLGPFERMPSEVSLPRGDDYVILQRMGRLPDSGKSIFRQVGTVSN